MASTVPSGAPSSEGFADSENRGLHDAFLRAVDADNDDYEVRSKYIRELPKLKEQDISDPDDACPVCQETFASIIALEELAYVNDTPGIPEEHLGVTELPCKHRFCRKDLTTWIRANNTCPACRGMLPLPQNAQGAMTDLPQELRQQILERANIFRNFARHPSLLEQLDNRASAEPSGRTFEEVVAGALGGQDLMTPESTIEYNEDRSNFSMYS